MGFAFNPFTGNFDVKGAGGGGGASYIDGEVATYADLPLDGTAALNSAWLVRTASGVWPVSRKQAGIYIRTATGGSNRDADYTYAGTMPDVFSDSVFLLYDEASTTRTGQFNLGSITAGQNRVLTWPDASGRIQVEGQAIGNTTPAAGTFTTLAANNGTLTASAPVLDLAQTWNNAAVTFSGARIDITNTASATGSRFLDCIIGGASAIRLARIGSAPYALFGTTDTGIGAISTSQASIIANGGVAFVVNSGSGGAYIRSDASYAWASGTNLAGASSDLTLVRDAADTLAQRRTTNPQTFRLYNTYTDASNHERLSLRWASNVAIIGTEKAGTGSARALELQTDGTTRLTVQTGGTVALSSHLTAESGFVRIASAQAFQWLNRSKVYSLADGNIGLYNAGENSFNLLQFGGTTTSFPALKRSSTVLQARLANDSDFCPLQGQLRIHQNAVSETITATHTLTLYDAAGTAYKVPCVAA